MEKDNCCGVSEMEMRAIKDIEENLKKFADKGEKVFLQKGHVLFYEGHAPYGFYILKKGGIRFSRTNMHGQKIFLPVGEDKIFGLYHLVTNTPYCATAEAKSDLEVLFISKSVILDSLEHHH